MNKLAKLFEGFNNNISLSESYKQKIRTGRNSIRSRIGNYFEQKDQQIPKHHTQGSYAMHTSIMPLEDEDFDLDNGVYLQGYDDNRECWPEVSNVHCLVKEAVQGHTKEIIDKDTCVRVVYQDNYHLDLPIYIMGKDDDGQEVAYLAHKKEGWIISDPVAFRNWFNDATKPSPTGSLRRSVKYLKQWIHHNKIDIPGMAVSILVAENFSDEGDDALTLLRVVTDIIDDLEENYSCYKPVRPKTENLFSKHSYYDQSKNLNQLELLKNKLAEAIYDSKNQYEASIVLREVFWEKRFPIGEKDILNEEYLKTSEPEKVGKKNRHYA